VDELLDSNLRSAVWGCRAAGKRMVAARRAGGAGGAGCIINVSSLLARRGAVGTSVYAAAKAGLLGTETGLPTLPSGVVEC
jgi:3-oxoacyl-[acyl-carrier protein] reductase